MKYLIILMLMSISVLADRPSDGTKIYMRSGEVIQGEVNMRGEVIKSYVEFLHVESNGEKISVLARDIDSVIMNNRTFVTLNVPFDVDYDTEEYVNYGYVHMGEKMIEGPSTLYFCYTAQGNIQDVIIDVNEEMVLLDRGNYKDKISELYPDHHELIELIESKEIEFEELDEAIDLANEL